MSELIAIVCSGCGGAFKGVIRSDPNHLNRNTFPVDTCHRCDLSIVKSSVSNSPSDNMLITFLKQRSKQNVRDIIDARQELSNLTAYMPNGFIFKLLFRKYLARVSVLSGVHESNADELLERMYVREDGIKETLGD